MARESDLPLEDVRLIRNVAEHLGQLAARQPPHELHLEQPLRPVQPADAEERIAIRLRPDLRHAARVERDLDRRATPVRIVPSYCATERCRYSRPPCHAMNAERDDGEEDVEDAAHRK